MLTPLKGDKQVNSPQSPDPIDSSLSSKRDQQTSSQLADPDDANVTLKSEPEKHLPQPAPDAAPADPEGPAAVSQAPEQDQPIDLSKTSTTAVRVFQALLLIGGLGWAVAWSHWPQGFDYMQGPGFLIAMSISWWLTPEIRARALRLGLVDKPGEERRIHKVAVPRLGGVAIYISVIATVVGLVAICGRFPQEARGSEGGLAGIAVGGTLIFVLGLLDDLESLPAKAKLLVQIVAGCVAYSLGVRIKHISIPATLMPQLMHLGSFFHLDLPKDGIFQLGPLSSVITVIWLVGIANAVNLIDGMDGLAAGVSLISALTIWSVALADGIDRPYAALAAAVLAGALLGFLRWNFNPARIFLGDSGAYLVGFILGSISVMGVIKVVPAGTVIVPTFLLVLLILFFPILDTSWAIVRRVAKGKSPFEPDAGHIHHRLLRTGLSQKKVAYLIYGVSALLGLIAAALVGQTLYFLCLAAAVLVMALFFSEVLNRHRQRQKKPNEIDPDDKGETAK
ncbi:MAG TPA: MraY family glycosyltransferase [Planktothrix sp.]|jgi:UDP-GlcNAc:undecaprenyl-phosphate GlcNAc-1-phosphate transferase